MLLPQGRLAGYVIHTPDGLDPDQVERVSEMGPAYGLLEVPPQALLAAAGFALTGLTDVTPEFRQMLTRIHDERSRREEQLRREEGDELFEEAQERKVLTLRCVDEGLLVRTLWVARRD